MKSAFIVRPGGDVAEAATFARDEEIDGLELMFHGPSPEDFTGAAETKRIAADHGVEIAAVGVWHLGMADPKEAGSDEVLAAATEYAGVLGAHCFFTGTGEPVGNDPVGALAEVYPRWAEMARHRGMKLAVYLGHKGSFINTEELLADACERVDGLGLKLDPIGIIRNLNADPYDVLHRYGASTAHFHVKDRLRLADGEIEPPPGLGELEWGRIFGILHQHSYDGYVSVEPHGKFWNQREKRWDYIRLAVRHVRQFMT